jgi:mono/diheme cytochrome c family protein
MDMKCTSSCHEPNGLLGGPGGSSMNAMLDLKPASGYSQLTTMKSLQVTDMWLVGTGLEDSYLWHKLQNTQTTLPGGEMTIKMPFGAELTDEQIALIEAWIAGTTCP